MPPYQIIEADAVAWAQAYDGAPFHALLCDPPYHLTSISKRFGKPGSAPAQFGRDGVFSRASAGFMGQTWDGGDIAFRPETWAAFLRIMHPGAFGMAFASSRGWHRLACAIEDAGFIIHPSIFGWLQGQGFPKATRVDTQIDRAQAQRIKYETRRAAVDAVSAAGLHIPDNSRWDWTIGEHAPGDKWWAKFLDVLPSLAREKREEVERTIVLSVRKSAGWFTTKNIYDITIPQLPDAKTWEHHRYGLQAAKPALEPIIVFQRPYEGRPVDDITRTGAGALNIDGARIESGSRPGRIAENHNLPRAVYEGGAATHGGSRSVAATNLGRWPANFALVHAPECSKVGTTKVRTGTAIGGLHNASGTNAVYAQRQRRLGQPDDGYADAEGFEAVDVWKCVDGCPVAALDEQAGRRRASGSAGTQPTYLSNPSVADFGGLSHAQGPIYNDVGPASRFFFTAAWSLEETDPVRYEEKASTEERDRGLLTFLPCLQYGKANVVHDPDDGTGLTTKRHYRLDAKGQPVRDAERNIIYSDCRRNGHPTVKPVSLARWLATLLLPPIEYAPRRIFVPFAGVGSEMIGAKQAGWDEVIGIESKRDYAIIAEARLRAWIGML